MPKPLALLAILILALGAAQRGAQSGYVVPLKITAVPSDSFRKGNTVTLKATFDRKRVEAITGVLCEEPGFAIRIYDPAKVTERGPLLKADTNQPQLYPMTRYIQEATVKFDPLSGPNDLTAEKIFNSFKMPAMTSLPQRLYLGFFRICDFDKGGKVIGDSGSGPEVISQTERENGTFLWGANFRWNCSQGRRQCFFKQE
ncbi:MAG TPA: hypothetical protein VJM50_04225 [Pyrinomonadaceae bacterium]|nr:hypothetical protein [Pyrinomonadaceae bacterium]